jgi:hypothetical protein
MAAGPRNRTLRVSDAEREEVAETLRREHVNGRIDVVEFQDRLERCLAAKTYADLDALLADLPGSEPARPRRSLTWPAPIVLVPIALIALVAATHGRVLWLAFPFFCFFVLRPLVWGSWHRGYRGRW